MKLIGFMCIAFILAFGGIIYYLLEMRDTQTTMQTSSGEENSAPVSVRKTVAPPSEISSKDQQSLTDIVAVTQKKVYTIFSDYGQGSGFLINDQGDVATNAHVVEGSVYVTVKDIDGKEHDGTVIGYSTETDIALIHVVDFVGRAPLNLETSTKAEVGEEVIAFGSPLALENTATFGYITGVDRSFVLDPHSYDNIYQTSAAIAPGSSGGPLVSKKTGRVLAINSVKLTSQDAIGFSIPFKDVSHLLMEWSRSPLSETEVNKLFYTTDGLLFFEEYWDDNVYFDGGEYSDDAEYDFYDIPEGWEYEEKMYEDETVEEFPYNEELYEEKELPFIEQDDEGIEEVPFESSPIDEVPLEETPVEDEMIPFIKDINDDGVIDVHDVTEDVNLDGIIDEIDLHELLLMQKAGG
ncbi:S1C family serine protease [Domibacillus mangrovi]|uniref:Serine protease n=1 Tax=Domibacillus mangrovi TaxID=1714354 RepID=A0A1Q5P2B8_9BACI|nr:trypsin-like peptidase domain-containing protein [Domibacillus mangrovi]OKL36389.1 hypothetical protein BLL40_10885 [Domibacillus mangrovi]